MCVIIMPGENKPLLMPRQGGFIQDFLLGGGEEEAHIACTKF